MAGKTEKSEKPKDDASTVEQPKNISSIRELTRQELEALRQQLQRKYRG